MTFDRTWTDIYGRKHVMSDEAVVEKFLEGRVDYYSGGELEHMRQELNNLRTKTAEILVLIGGDIVTKYCEKELE